MLISIVDAKGKPDNDNHLNPYFEFPTSTWVIEKQDYFGKFIEWNFFAVDGLQGDKKTWNFSWMHIEKYEIWNSVTHESTFIVNPIFEIRNAWNGSSWNLTLLQETYDNTEPLHFKNWGDFQSDCDRLVSGNYPIIPEDRNEFTGLHDKIDIFSHNNGSFIVEFKDQWKMEKKITIGYGSTITYSGVDNAITCIGGTEGTPINFWDLWNASNVNGWGVVSNHNTLNVQYEFDCAIYIGDAVNTTWFADTLVQVRFLKGIVTLGKYAIWIRTNGHFRLGYLYDAPKHETGLGCHLIGEEDAIWIRFIYQYGYDTSCELYSTIFQGVGANRVHLRLGDIARVWNCQFQQGFHLWALDTIYDEADIYNLVSSDIYFLRAQLWGNAENIQVYTTGHYIWMESKGDYTIKNLYGRGDNSGYTIRVGSLTQDGDVYLVNPDLDRWDLYFTGTSTREIYRQYEFDLKIIHPNATNIENANVTLWYYGQGGSQINSWLTFPNGSIPQQTLIMGFYNQTGSDTIYNYNPYNLTIFKDGLQTYTKNFTLSEKTVWEIALSLETEMGNGETEYLFISNMITGVPINTMFYIVFTSIGIILFVKSDFLGRIVSGIMFAFLSIWISNDVLFNVNVWYTSSYNSTTGIYGYTNTITHIDTPLLPLLTYINIGFSLICAINVFVKYRNRKS